MEFTEDIHWWRNYEPKDSDYVDYHTYITSAMFQVIGVYNILCKARASLEFIECNDYGELISCSDENHLAFIRNMFIESSIIYYNICVDLSWQVLWLYCEQDDLNIIYNQKTLDKILKRCNYSELIYRLKLGGLEKIIKKLKEFNEYLHQSGVRTKYNYIKHRGVYHYNGFGENYSTMLMSYNGMEVKIFSRKEINVNEWSEMLLNFDFEFVKYFNYILEEIVPKGYLQKSDIFSNEYTFRFIDYCEQIKKEVINKNI